MHEFPRHHQRNGLFITYPTHNVIRWNLLCYLLQYEPAHLINAVVCNNLIPNNVNLQQMITRGLSMNQILPTPLAITLEHYPSNEIFSQSILVMILCRWCAMLSQRAVGRWISPCGYDTEPIPYSPLPWCDMVGLSDSTVEALIDDHDPSRIMDFHQLFIGDNQSASQEVKNGFSEGVRTVPLCFKKHAQRIFHDFGTACLRALGINNQANQCYISTVHLPSCYQGILNNDSLLIIDSGASICIMPHRSDFITYQQSKMKIKISVHRTMSLEKVCFVGR